MTANLAISLDALLPPNTTPIPSLQLVHNRKTPYDFILQDEQAYLRNAKKIFDRKNNRVANYRFHKDAITTTRTFSLVDGIVVVRPNEDVLALHQYNGVNEPVGKIFDKEYYVRIRHKGILFHVYTHA